jgi:transcription-repair coupling factor (superfamily II helicase)
MICLVERVKHCTFAAQQKMDIKELQKSFAVSPKVGALAKALENSGIKTIFMEGLVASATPLLFSALALKSENNPDRQDGGSTNYAKILFILNDADEAGYFYHDLTQVMGEKQVLFFPSSFRRSVKYAQRDSANEILRTEVLSRLSAVSGRSEKEALYVVSYPEAVAELVISRQILDERTLELHVGEHVDVRFIEETLRTFGFTQEDYVYEPGQYAVRGSIIDVFSFSSEYPYRIDFFGDDVDSIRTFEVQTQLSRDKKEYIKIVPELNNGGKSTKVAFTKFLPKDTVIAMRDFVFVHDVIENTYHDGFSHQALTEMLEGATEEEQKRIYSEMKSENQLMSATEFTSDIVDFRRIEFGTKPTGTPQATVRFNISPQPLFHKNFDLLTSALNDYLERGYKLFVLADSQKQNQRLREIFHDMAENAHATPIDFTPVEKTIHEGFADNDSKVCLYTDHQIFDRYHKYNLRSDKARSGKISQSLKELNQLQPGDYVVHVDHGVGKFAGLVRVPTADGYQEMLKLTYSNDDIVYVSIHSLYKVSKYKGKENGEPPRLNRLGTGAWENLKERTKKKIKDIARDLIKLYSARRNQRGFAYSGDSFMQHELEASFLYEDTPDQLKATQDVKADMESDKPMDRLVCGDVGFGKTEVAIRAAFKACCDDKQVAVLVPTTVLAYQHYKTFTERLSNFPVRVDYLTRARSAKKAKEITDDLAAGKINIIIGTHKLIGKAVKFKDLGLLIIDEEQKFGVSTKEKLRQMKVNVDTLTLTATPIPRTLQFSLMGARDLSVIQTPPPNRYPIQTEVHTFSAEVIADAINFEMSRNGQVFFVNSRISNLPELADVIHRHVPDARVAIGHGQMNPEELEKIIYGFVNDDYDVLLSTTIVENGIDIPNANTIIINGAQNFGLSDLHQMRGRVGRSNKKAFCYLLAPPLASLSDEARRRLQAIENFSELGSGLHLAMQDLDIRGAGNLLGAEQSGFIADLGYETYQKILREAVTELKNDEFADMYREEKKKGVDLSGDMFVDDCTFESDLEMYFPDEYVPSSSERMLLYRELDNIRDDNELETYRKNLVDRFGDIPKQGDELMQVVVLRRLGKQLGFEKITLKAQQMRMYFVGNNESAYFQSDSFEHCLNYIAKYPRRCQLKEYKGRRFMIVTGVNSVGEGVGVLRDALQIENSK